MTALFALATSLLRGLADFGGGLFTRRIPALTVVVVSQAAAAVVLGVIVIATGGWSEAGPQLWFAVAAGVVGPVAMPCFYKALALGPMGVVSPLGSLGVAVPAAFGFGSVMSLIAEASTTVTGLFLALFVQRLTNFAVGGTALFASVRRGARALPEEGGSAAVLAALPVLALIGLADVAANGTYAITAQHGPVTVAAVLASLYPVVTAPAARGVLKERLRGVQAAGAGLALVGTVLLATG
ncbi:EamA family transporter [Streptomyces sp. NPDC059802]|uniref:EamA family transporter n=1 Tax=Streptomyces sp. NPDC059802 TaxID=3346952 RepID=UPI00364A77CD